MNGLPETGVVDEGTWRKLLGEEFHTLKAPAEVLLLFDTTMHRDS